MTRYVLRNEGVRTCKEHCCDARLLHLHPRMKERPIIFSGDNPKLILEGRKTQTRRLVKNHNFAVVNGRPHFAKPDGSFYECPYGVAGDQLYVREKHLRWGVWKGRRFSSLGYKYRKDFPEDRPWRYTFDEPFGNPLVMPSQKTEIGWHYRPSIFMPKLLARIWLEILRVRVERLQDISVEDAIAEGLSQYGDKFWTVEGVDWFSTNPRKAFSILWDSLHGAGAWEKNSWCWVIEFRRKVE